MDIVNKIRGSKMKYTMEIKNIIEEDIVTNNNNYPKNYKGYKPFNKWMDKFEPTEVRRSKK